MARARQRSCFCPWERFSPPEDMGDERFRKILRFSSTGSAAVVEELLLPSAGVSATESSGTGVLLAEGIRWTFFKASLRSKSLNSSKGSRFERMVPEKRTGSWGITARRVRRS